MYKSSVFSGSSNSDRKQNEDSMAMVVKFLFIFAPDYTALYVRCPVRHVLKDNQQGQLTSID